MSEQFISVITDEAMGRVCYDGGWNLKPWRFCVSETDVFKDYTGEIFDKQGNVTPEAFLYLKGITTEWLQDDYDTEHVWYQGNFSSLSQATPTTLTHHITIPGNVDVTGNTKDIKTIYFIYQDNVGEEFLYALARCNKELIYEEGIAQSFFFNFTVTNAEAQPLSNFVLNYSCSHEIEDHNTDTDVHTHLLARDGSRSVTGILKYASSFTFTDPNQLITKSYVDNYSTSAGATLVPAGTLRFWPGRTAPAGWAVRAGQYLYADENPNLFKVLDNGRYGTRTVGNRVQFKLMNDLGIFIRGCEGTYNESTGAFSITNGNYLAGVGYAMEQQCGAPDVTGSWPADNSQTGRSSEGGAWVGPGGAFYKGANIEYDISSKGSGNGAMMLFALSRMSGVYQAGLREVRVYNRNYLPIIKLG